MTSDTPKQTGSTPYLDYRPSRCRCGSIVRPYENVCLQCGRQQNLLFEGLEKIPKDGLDELIVGLENETARNPYDYIKMFRLAGAHILRGHFENARDVYRSILQKKPDFSPARLNLGITLACLGEQDAAASELRQFVKLEPHSSKAERVIRAICSIKNIPYEDALKETGIEQGQKGPAARRPGTYLPPRGKLGRQVLQPEPVAKHRKQISRPWLVFDLFMLFVIAAILIGWFKFPDESKTFLASGISVLERPFQFEVENGAVKAEGGTENNQALSTSQPEDQTPPGGIANSQPSTSSYLPLKAGNSWTYASYDTRDAAGQSIIRSGGGKTMTVTRQINTRQHEWEVRNGTDLVYYVEQPDGLFSITDPKDPWNNMIVQVPYPATVGTSRTTLGQTVTVEAEEDIEVPAGKFHCVRLKYTVKEPSGMEWYAWYAQGIGLVKYRGGSGDEGSSYHFLDLAKYTLN